MSKTDLREGYAELDDVRLHYVEAGEGPLVVLLHGFPEFWYAWRQQIEPLAAAGFRVVAPDMRGYNTSSRPEEVHAYDTAEAGGGTAPPRTAPPVLVFLLLRPSGPARNRRARGPLALLPALPARRTPGLHPGRNSPLLGERDRYLSPELAEPDHDDVPNLDRVERLPDASHWVHHDEAERVTQLLTDFFAPARPAKH
jgi:pimeloyl-ACP methyl ester carboxylesterase